MKTILHKALLSVSVVFFIFLSCSKNNDIVIENATKMFKNHQSIKIIERIDYIGFSFHHEIYDIRIYQVVNGEINPGFCFDVLINPGFVSKKLWLQCDGNNPTTNYFPMVDTKNNYRKEVLANIYSGLSVRGNWYSWIIEKDMNHLFLLCPDNNLLYYVKWNV